MDPRTELVDVIRRVRNRWRLRLALRGAVVVAAGTVLALLLSASGLESFRFSAPAIITFRIIIVAVFVGLLFYGLVWPLRRRVTDAQVAMYLEECDPTLEAAIISAVEATAGGGSPAHSPRLVDKLVEQAIDQCRALEQGRTIERTAVQRHAGALAAIAALVALVLAFGPAYFRHGLSALLIFHSAEASSPYSIEVTPGNTKVPRGADQAMKARLVGFASSDVSVMMRIAPDGSFDRVPLIASAQAGTFEGMLFHLEKPTEYYVESNGVRSGKFMLTVVELPTVQQLDLEYRFPAYTGLEPRKAEGGDVAAIRGTDVMLHVVPTMTTPDGKILLSDGTALPLTRQADGSLTGSFPIKTQGFYRIELTGPHGEKVEASPQYTIDVLDNQPPSVHFTKPGRDSQASPVEELFLEARADDDFGVKSLQLFYSVNGGTPKTVNLFGGPKPLTEVSAGHTIYLEELGLKPGDFVSYYAKASDTDAVQGSKTTTSDIYFVQIRPFKKDYKPSQSQAGGGGGGGGGGQQVGQLSQQQREIVAATFNIVRDKAKTKPEKFRENVVFLNLAQAKLRDQVEELVGKLKARLGTVDPALQQDRRGASEGSRGDEGRRVRSEGDEGGYGAVAGAARAQAASGRRAGIRAAGGATAGRRWRWRRPAERARRRPGGSVRARAGQTRQPVPDAAARRTARQRPAGRSARRETEGAGAPAAAGDGAAAPDGAIGSERLERIQRVAAGACRRSGKSGAAARAAHA